MSASNENGRGGPKRSPAEAAAAFSGRPRAGTTNDSAAPVSTERRSIIVLQVDHSSAESDAMRVTGKRVSASVKLAEASKDNARAASILRSHALQFLSGS